MGVPGFRLEFVRMRLVHEGRPVAFGLYRNTNLRPLFTIAFLLSVLYTIRTALGYFLLLLGFPWIADGGAVPEIYFFFVLDSLLIIIDYLTQ